MDADVADQIASAGSACRFARGALRIDRRCIVEEPRRDIGLPPIVCNGVEPFFARRPAR
jgi:hypothetical protein